MYNLNKFLNIYKKKKKIKETYLWRNTRNFKKTKWIIWTINIKNNNKQYIKQRKNLNLRIILE